MELNKALHYLEHHKIEIGIYDKRVNGYAWFIHNGTYKIEPHPFISDTIKQNQREISRRMSNIVLSVIYKGDNPKYGLEKLGRYLVVKVKQYIRMYDLIDTGRMYRSIKYRIKEI